MCGAGRMTENGIISVWRVVAPPGYGALGDVVSVGLDPPNAPVQVMMHGKHMPKHTFLSAIDDDLALPIPAVAHDILFPRKDVQCRFIATTAARADRG